MKQGRLTVVVLLFVLFFTFNAVAEDLFDLDGGSGDSTAGPESDAVAAPDEGNGGENVAAPEQKKKKKNTVKTQKVDINAAVQDVEGEKVLRELTIDEKRRIKVVQRRAFFKAKRFELGIDLALVSGDWNHSFAVGARALYHFNEYFGLMGRFMYAPVDWDRDIKEQVDELHARVSSSTLQMTGGLSAVFTPFYGKISVFGNMIAKYDLNASLGLYYYGTDVDGDIGQSDKNHDVAVQVGFATKFVFAKNWNVGLNFDWFMMQDKRFKLGQQAGSDAKVSYLKTDFMFTVNVGMLLPFNN